MAVSFGGLIAVGLSLAEPASSVAGVDISSAASRLCFSCSVLTSKNALAKRIPTPTPSSIGDNDFRKERYFKDERDASNSSALSEYSFMASMLDAITIIASFFDQFSSQILSARNHFAA